MTAVRHRVEVAPGDRLDLRDPAWAGALVVLVDGVLGLVDEAGRRFAFRRGDLLVLAGTDAREAVSLGPRPVVLVAVRRERPAAEALPGPVQDDGGGP